MDKKENKLEIQESKEGKTNLKAIGMAIGICVGSSGIALGAAFNHMEIGCFTIMFGMLIGMLIGSSMEEKEVVNDNNIDKTKE